MTIATERLNGTRAKVVAHAVAEVKAKTPEERSAKENVILALTESTSSEELELLWSQFKTAQNGNAKPYVFERVSGAAIYEDDPPVAWVCEPLQICAGRPAMFAGYSFSGKTLSAMALNLAVLTGRPIWGHFPATDPTRKRRVLHVDNDQGFKPTKTRYRRIARAMGIQKDDFADRLDIIKRSTLYLTIPSAEEYWAEEVKGYDLVLLDAFRGLIPGLDENAAEVADVLYMLMRVSERTGAAFIVIHHSGKPQKDRTDNRTKVRGSSAIFGACGSVFLIGGPKDGIKKVQHEKSAPDAEVSTLPDFYLDISPFATSTDANAGLSISYVDPADIEIEGAGDDAKDAAARERAYATIAMHPKLSVNGLIAHIRMNDTNLSRHVKALVAAGRVENRGTATKPEYWIRTP